MPIEFDELTRMMDRGTRLPKEVQRAQDALANIGRYTGVHAADKILADMHRDLRRPMESAAQLAREEMLEMHRRKAEEAERVIARWDVAIDRQASAFQSALKDSERCRELWGTPSYKTALEQVDRYREMVGIAHRPMEALDRMAASERSLAAARTAHDALEAANAHVGGIRDTVLGCMDADRTSAMWDAKRYEIDSALERAKACTNSMLRAGTYERSHFRVNDYPPAPQPKIVPGNFAKLRLAAIKRDEEEHRSVVGTGQILQIFALVDGVRYTVSGHEAFRAKDRNTIEITVTDDEGIVETINAFHERVVVSFRIVELHLKSNDLIH